MIKKLSVLPSFKERELSTINSNGISVGEYSPLNWVVIDNILIQSKHNLNNIEQKLLEYLVSLINLKNPTRKIQVKKRDIINFLFPNARNKKSNELSHYYYNRLQQACYNIGNSSITIKFDNKKGLIIIPFCAFIDHEDSSYIIVAFSPEILPFLCFLEGNFTQYKICYIEKLKGNHSICLYKYFKMKNNIKNNTKKKKIVSWHENLNDLRFILDIEKRYKEMKSLRLRVLEPSIKEINKNTDINITYNIIRGGSNGRKILGLEFTAQEKYKKTAKEKSNLKPNDFQVKNSILTEVTEGTPIEENINLIENEKPISKTAETENTKRKPDETKKKSIFERIFKKMKKGENNGKK